jgi:hypothetical protein
MHPVVKKRCERDGLDFEVCELGEDDLEPDPGGPLEMEQPTEIVAKPLSPRNQDDRVRMVFGLTQQEIYAAMRAGKLQFRGASMHGNPWFRLLRHEVEALVQEKSGQGHLYRKKLEKELADINRETRKLKARLASLERRRAELAKELDG